LAAALRLSDTLWVEPAAIENDVEPSESVWVLAFALEATFMTVVALSVPEHAAGPHVIESAKFFAVPGRATFVVVTLGAGSAAKVTVVGTDDTAK
jgi:hypothetical protein